MKSQLQAPRKPTQSPSEARAGQGEPWFSWDPWADSSRLGRDVSSIIFDSDHAALLVYLFSF